MGCRSKFHTAFFYRTEEVVLRSSIVGTTTILDSSLRTAQQRRSRELSMVLPTTTRWADEWTVRIKALSTIARKKHACFVFPTDYYQTIKSNSTSIILDFKKNQIVVLAAPYSVI